MELLNQLWWPSVHLCSACHRRPLDSNRDNEWRIPIGSIGTLVASLGLKAIKTKNKHRSSLNFLCAAASSREMGHYSTIRNLILLRFYVYFYNVFKSVLFSSSKMSTSCVWCDSLTIKLWLDCHSSICLLHTAGETRVLHFPHSFKTESSALEIFPQMTKVRKLKSIDNITPLKILTKG